MGLARYSFVILVCITGLALISCTNSKQYSEQQLYLSEPLPLVVRCEEIRFSVEDSSVKFQYKDWNSMPLEYIEAFQTDGQAYYATHVPQEVFALPFYTDHALYLADDELACPMAGLILGEDCISKVCYVANYREFKPHISKPRCSYHIGEVVSTDVKHECKLRQARIIDVSFDQNGDLPQGSLKLESARQQGENYLLIDVELNELKLSVPYTGKSTTPRFFFVIDLNTI